MPSISRFLQSIPITVAVCISVAFPAIAQWAEDPYLNLAVADQSGDQVLPLIANISDGGCYIGWFNNASGNYDVYLQRLDRDGNELWPHNGVLISSNTQSSSLTAWDLICDSGDNAVLTFCDSRAGSDLDIYGYKIAQIAMLA